MLIFFIISTIFICIKVYIEMVRHREFSEKFKKENKEYCEILDRKYAKELKEIIKKGEQKWNSYM